MSGVHFWTSAESRCHRLSESVAAGSASALPYLLFLLGARMIKCLYLSGRQLCSPLWSRKPTSHISLASCSKINLFPRPWPCHGKHKLRLKPLLSVNHLPMRYPNGLAWQLNVPKKALRRFPELKKFHSFLVFETEVVFIAFLVSSNPAALIPSDREISPAKKLCLCCLRFSLTLNHIMLFWTCAPHQDRKYAHPSLSP